MSHKSFADAARSPLQFFIVELHKRQVAERQLAQTGAITTSYQPTINESLLAQKKQAIQKLRAFMRRQKITTTQTETMQAWLTRREAEVAFVEAAAALHQTNGITPTHIQAFNLACDNLYGQYDADLFYYHVATLITAARIHQTDAAWEYVADHMPLSAIALAAKTITPPSSDDVAYYQQLGMTHFAAVDETVQRHITKDQETYDSTMLQAMITELLQVTRAAHEGWQVLQSIETTKIAVNYTRKVIFIRQGHFRMAPYRLRGLLAHEVMVHVRRALHTLPARQLAAQASAHKQSFEEGLGVFAEQIFLPEFRYLRQFRYVAIGLAKGVDGKPRSFAEVYELIWRLKYLTQRTGTEATARHYAFDEVSRVFRGLPLEVRGAAFTKDKMYIEGNADVWRALKQRMTPAVFADFLLKK